jgi:hypothetical protein
VAKDSPLTNVDLSNINGALQQLNSFKVHLGNAKQAGIDTEPFERQADYYEQQLNMLKQTYFPNKP